jgi:predicted GNAT family N-acyltransferase
MCWREDGELVGCVSIRWLGEGVVKLRQMAVRTERQGEGVGRRLLAAVLGLLREKEVREVRLHAREAVVEFYEKLGFECFGERFEEVGIAHRAMKRQI